MGIISSLLLDSIQRGNASDRASSYAAQVYGQDSPEARFAAAFPDQAPALFANQMKTDAEGNALSQALGSGKKQAPQQQAPFDPSLFGQGWNAQPDNGQSGMRWNNPLQQITQGMPADMDSMFGGQQQQGQPQQAPQNPIMQITQPDNVPDFVKNIDANPALLKRLPTALQTAYVTYKTNPLANSGASGLTGEEYLKTLPSNIAHTVKAIAEGRQPMPSGYALRSPYGQQIMSAVNEYDPSADAVNIAARMATRKDFTAGKSAQSINALNTVAEHLAALKSRAEKLDNGSIPLWNSFINTAHTSVGDNAVTNFDTAAGHVAQELTRAWRGTGGNQADIQRDLEDLGHDRSPKQIQGTLSTLAELLKGKIDALGDQYKRGMGTAAEDVNFYTPQASQSFNDLGFNVGGQGNDPPVNPILQATQQPRVVHFSDLKKR